MQIRNFSYFDIKQAADAKNTSDRVEDQCFDLDLQTMNLPSMENSQVPGSGHHWCIVTTECASLTMCDGCYEKK